ncbi:ribosome biogenesis GTPase [Caldicoprobacter guelmensis]|uniref:ribosome small subunit-dependent GTPase A n=1 Tax=Caldicoprobacter guelmensis TaxID=1170224 RepID=UPI00195D2DBE|nr:ribosome small subunit-dependent GTPase A [Caldicoprobacter guelmensis]MBM7581902.1 ribosome biogenesis GTPase [Caldicoprobacter guelmensis]
MEKGIIVKGVGGFYDVYLNGSLLRCLPRGKFRKQGITPMVGDVVEVNAKDAVIEAILPRKNQFKRPCVANIDNLGIVISVKHPDPDLLLVDKLILAARMHSVKPFIVINKIDLAEGESEIKAIEEQYRRSGCQIFCISCKDGTGIEELKRGLYSGITTFAGQSGVGKSSLINRLYPDISREVGDISEKTKRGKHTTRSVELLVLPDGKMLVDTPGFSALEVDLMQLEKVQLYYEEFVPYADQCRFPNCMHYREPHCAVKQAVQQGGIHEMRYQRYIRILEDIYEKRREQK